MNTEANLAGLNVTPDAMARKMSSREIAELTGKQHKHVLRDINVLIEQGAITEPNFGLSAYTDASGKSNPEYLLDFDATMTLVTGYNAVLRAKMKTAAHCRCSALPLASPRIPLVPRLPLWQTQERMGRSKEGPKSLLDYLTTTLPVPRPTHTRVKGKGVASPDTVLHELAGEGENLLGHNVPQTYSPRAGGRRCTITGLNFQPISYHHSPRGQKSEQSDFSDRAPLPTRTRAKGCCNIMLQ